MFSAERVFLLFAAVVLALLIPTGLVVLAIKTIWKDSPGKPLQIFSLTISSLAVLFALICLGGATIWAGPSGEWARLALLPAFFINLPAGLIALVIGVVVRRGVAGMRKICICMSVAALLSPFLAALLAR